MWSFAEEMDALQVDVSQLNGWAAICRIGSNCLGLGSMPPTLLDDRASLQTVQSRLAGI